MFAQRKQGAFRIILAVDTAKTQLILQSNPATRTYSSFLFCLTCKCQNVAVTVCAYVYKKPFFLLKKRNTHTHTKNYITVIPVLFVCVLLCLSFPENRILPLLRFPQPRDSQPRVLRSSPPPLPPPSHPFTGHIPPNIHTENIIHISLSDKKNPLQCSALVK